MSFRRTIDTLNSYKNFNLEEAYALVTLHPSHLEKIDISAQVEIVLNSIKSLNMNIVITAPNPDADSKIIYQEFKSFSKKNKRVYFFENLGSNYYSFLKKAKILIGNSSSGIWESSSFKVPVVNIGIRQDGRVRSKNVIDVQFDETSIKKAIQKCLSDHFRKSISNISNPYFIRNSLQLIEDHILQFPEKNFAINKKIF